MKTIFTILIFLFALSSSAQNCDSTIVIFITHYDEDYGLQLIGSEIDSIKNGVVISKNFENRDPILLRYDSLNRIINVINNDSVVYTYDSLSRLIYTDKYGFDGTNWVYFNDTARKEHLFNSIGRDSLKTIYSWNGTSLFKVHEEKYIYNLIDTLIRIEIRDLISSQWIFDTLAVVSYPIGLPGTYRVDSIYTDSVSHTYPFQLNYYDNLNRILEKDEMLYEYIVNYYEQFGYTCNQQSGYHQSCYGCHSGSYVNTLFDSLCNIRSTTNGHYNSSGDTYSLSTYYYLDCNRMAIVSSFDEKICRGDTVPLISYPFGGTPPYQTQWNPSVGLISDTSLTTKAFPDTTTRYIITVTDSLGVSITDTILITVVQPPVSNIHIVSIDTLSACQSAVIANDSIYGYYNLWRRDSSYQWLGYYSHLTIHYNGIYILNTGVYNCPDLIDTFAFNGFSNPIPEVILTKGCHELYATKTKPSIIKWYYNNQLIVDSIRDTLVVVLDGNYKAIAVDSAGCQSDEEYIQFTEFKLTSGMNKSCEDSCNGRLSLYPYYAVHFLWSTGDTLPVLDSVCPGIYSVIATNQSGCTVSLQDTVTAFPHGNYSYLSTGTSGGAACDGIVIPVDTSNNTYSATYLWEDSTTNFEIDSVCSGWHHVLTTPYFSHCAQNDSFFVANSHSNDTCRILISKTDPRCTGDNSGSATVTSSTGSPYACQWLNPSTGPLHFTLHYGLTAGTFTAIIIDKNGCVDTGSITLNDPPPLSSTYSVYQSTCDDTCTFTAIGAGGTPPYLYQWCDGTYGVQYPFCVSACQFITNDSQGCTFTNVAFAPATNFLVVTTINNPATCQACNNGSIIINVSGGTPPYLYSVDSAPPNSNDTVVNLAGGNHQVCVTDANGCSNCQNAYVFVGINSLEDVSFNLFPNPFSESATIVFNENFLSGEATLLMTDMLGKTFMTQKLYSDPFELKRGNLPSGIYILTIRNTENIVLRKRVVIE